MEIIPERQNNEGPYKLGNYRMYYPNQYSFESERDDTNNYAINRKLQQIGTIPGKPRPNKAILISDVKFSSLS